MRILATRGLRSDAAHWRRGPLIEHAIQLAGDPERPRFCYLGTAAGDGLSGTTALLQRVRGLRRPRHPPRAVHDAQRRRRPRPPALPGRHLGRWRVGRQPARGLAGAPHRRGAARVLGERRRAQRRLGRARSAGTSAARPTATAPTCASRRPASACCPTATASTTTARSSAGRCCTRWSRRATCPPRTPPTTASASSTRAPSWSRRSPTGPAWRRTSSSARTTAPSSRPGSSLALLS